MFWKISKYIIGITMGRNHRIRAVVQSNYKYRYYLLYNFLQLFNIIRY